MFPRLFLAALVLALDVPCTPAAVRTWDGDGTNGLWLNPTNWVGDVAPMTGDDLVFPEGAVWLSNTNNFLNGTTFNSITISGTNYQLHGAGITLNAGINATNTTAQNLIFIPITLAANQTITSGNLGVNLYINGAIDTADRQLTFTGRGQTQVSGTIRGAGGLIKRGGGAALLYASNSFSGSVNILQGGLSIYNSNALGATTAFTSDAAGAFLGIFGAYTVAEPLFLSGTLVSGSGAKTLTGTIALLGNVFISVPFNETLTINSVVSGFGGFTTTSPGALILNAANTYTGATTNAIGRLIINGHQPAAAIFLDSGTLSGTGTVGAITALGIGATKIIRPGDGSGISPGVLTTSNLTLNSDTIVTIELNGTMPGTGYDQLNVRGAVTLSGPGPALSLNLSYPAIRGDTFTIIANDGTDAVTGIFDGMPEGATVTPNLFRISYMGGDGNDVVLTKLAQARVWDGGGANAYWLNPTNWHGNFAPSSGDALFFPRDVAGFINTNNFPADAVFHSITIGAPNYQLYGTNIVLNAGVTVTNTTGISSINFPIRLGASQTFALPASNSTAQCSLTAPIDLSGYDLTFSAGSGAWEVSSPIDGLGTLTKTGDGFLALYASNSFAGVVNVLGGRLNIYNNQALGLTTRGTGISVGGSLGLVGVNDVDEPLDFFDSTLFSGGGGSNQLTGPVKLSGNVQFDISTPLIIDGVISDGDFLSGGFHKFSPAVLTLNANNTYTRATTNTDGMLIINGTMVGNQIVLNGGILGGTGEVASVVATAGPRFKVLNPGNAGNPISRFLSGNVFLSSFTRLHVDIAGTTPAAGHDQLVVGGTLNLGDATADIVLTFAPAIGDAFTIIRLAGTTPVIGTFAGVPDRAVVPDIFGDTWWQITYRGGDGNDVVLTRVNSPSRLSSIMTINNGEATFQGEGLSNLTYTIEASSNLFHWTNIGTAAANNAGLYNFVDTNALLFMRRFYRAISP